LVDERKLDAIVPAFVRRLNGDDDDLHPEDERQPGTTSISSGIAVIPVIGSLIRRKTGLDAWSGLTSYSDIEQWFDTAVADPRARGVLFQIDTYGGEQGGCFELCDRINRARGTKPIWAVADINALSAGYAIGSQCDRFVVAPSGMVASIGVVAVHCETSQLNENLGVTYTVFRAGAYKADGNSLEPLSSFFSAKLQASMDRNRQTFAELVARGRPGVTVKAALATEGQWYDPPDALRLKLVDGIQTYEEAFDALAATVPPPVVAAPPPTPLAPVEPDDPDDPDGPAEPDPPSVKGTIIMTDTPQPAATPPIPAAAAVVVPPPAAAATVVSIDQARTEARQAAAAESLAIVELCQLAGHPGLASEFLAKGATVDDVRKALLDAKAKADQNLGHITNQPPGKPVVTREAVMAGWDAAFEKANAARR